VRDQCVANTRGAVRIVFAPVVDENLSRHSPPRSQLVDTQGSNCQRQLWRSACSVVS
jgi:hypothetical protein